jgi:hypothetical protein
MDSRPGRCRAGNGMNPSSAEWTSIAAPALSVYVRVCWYCRISFADRHRPKCSQIRAASSLSAWEAPMDQAVSGLAVPVALPGPTVGAALARSFGRPRRATRGGDLAAPLSWVALCRG